MNSDVNLLAVFLSLFQQAGNPLGIILEWIGSPVILGVIIILLVFIIILLKGKLSQSYEYLELRRKEEDLECKDIIPIS